MISHIKTAYGFHASINGHSYDVPKEHENYDILFSAVMKNDVETFINHYNTEDFLNHHFEGTDVEIEDGIVTYKGSDVHNSITERMIEYAEEGHEPVHMARFLDNLKKNPSNRAVTELYDFLAHRNLPITEDGHFIAYKAVKDDYMDKYSGQHDNSVGTVVEMPRNEVDDNPQNKCSHGFHVGAFGYAGPNGWYHDPGDPVMKVKVNPKDAVSVPVDHNAQKLRVCRYEVVGEIEDEQPLPSTLVKDEEPEPEVEEEIEDEVVEGEPTESELVEGQSYELHKLPVGSKVKTSGAVFTIDDHAYDGFTDFVCGNWRKSSDIVELVELPESEDESEFVGGNEYQLKDVPVGSVVTKSYWTNSYTVTDDKEMENTNRVFLGPAHPHGVEFGRLDDKATVILVSLPDDN